LHKISHCIQPFLRRQTVYPSKCLIQGVVPLPGSQNHQNKAFFFIDKLRTMRHRLKDLLQ
jgi:hypothetical protein